MFLKKRQKWLKRWHRHSIPNGPLQTQHSWEQGWRQRLRIWNLSCTDSICVSMMQSIWNANEVRREVYSPRWGALSTPERPTAPQQMKAASSPFPSSWSSRQNPDTRFTSPHLLWNTSNTQKWRQRLVNLREYRRQWLPTPWFSFPAYFSFLHF